jgi:hypothetical protein
MSVPAKGKTFPKMGKVFPATPSGPKSPEDYAKAIARALQAEVTLDGGSLKKIMKWTGVSERAVKVWLAGSSGPRGEHLIALMRNSDRLLQEVLDLAGRKAFADSDALLKLKSGLENAVIAIKSALDGAPH